MCSGRVTADYVKLSSGQEITGIIESDKHGILRIRTSEGLLTFPRKQVASISAKPPAQNTLIELQHAATRGDLHAVLPLLLEPAAKSDKIAETLVAYGAPIIASASQHIASDVEKFVTLAATGPLSGYAGVQVLSARLLASRNEYARAAELLLRVPTAPLLQTPALRRQLALALIECAEHFVSTSDEAAISRLFALMDLVYADSPTTHAAALLKVRASQNLVREKKWRDAIEVIGDSQAAAGAPYLRKQLLKVLESAQSQHDTTGTAEAGQLVLQQHSSWLTSSELEQLRRATALALASNGQYAEAFAIADKWSQEDPDKASDLQHRIELLRRKAEAGADQPMNQYKLAVWAREMGLLEEAGSILAKLRKEPLVAELAELQQELLDLDYAKAEFNRISAAYQATRYKDVISQAQRFRQHYGHPELTKRVLELEQLAKYYDTSKTKHSVDLAEAAFLNAERMYNQGKYVECIDQVNRLLLDYPSSRTAQRATQLLDKATKARTAKRPT